MEQKNERQPFQTTSTNQIKGSDFATQKITYQEYLFHNTATNSMAAAALSIPQKNLCRYKRTLEEEGSLWQIRYTKCPLTGFNAWHLTTNPAKAPKSPCQLSLFDEMKNEKSVKKFNQITSAPKEVK